MEQLLMGESPLDSEIANVRAQIETLRHRRSLLSHSLLTSRKLKSRIAQSEPNRNLTRAALDSIPEIVKQNEDTTVANLHRTCSGITAFRVQDPDPNAVDSGNVLGVRFDIFSAEDRSFKTQYYVLLNQPNRDGQLKVHKHTIPVYVPMQSLTKKYLPYKANAEEEDAAPKDVSRSQDLSKFVRALRKELVAHHKRLEAFKLLKSGLSRRQGVNEVKMLDATGKEIEIAFTNGILVRLRIATDGTIEKVAVGPVSRDGDDDAHEMKAYREIKKVVEGGSGRIDDLAQRLRQRA